MPEGTDDEALFSSSSKAFFRGSVTVLSGTGFLASRANHPYSGVADIANALSFTHPVSAILIKYEVNKRAQV
jgi:hypothetical protein